MAKNIPCKFSDLNDDITKPHGGYVNLDAWDKIKDKELEYIKKIYLEEPDDYLHYTKFEYVVDIHRSGKKPYMDCNNQKYYNQVYYHKRPIFKDDQLIETIGEYTGQTVCRCVFEVTGRTSHGAVIDYLRQVIKSGGIMPIKINVDDGMVIEEGFDGTHRLFANIQLGIEYIPAYINRDNTHWGSCWRPGWVLEDGTVDMSVDYSKGVRCV